VCGIAPGVSPPAGLEAASNLQNSVSKSEYKPKPGGRAGRDRKGQEVPERASGSTSVEVSPRLDSPESGIWRGEVVSSLRNRPSIEPESWLGCIVGRLGRLRVCPYGTFFGSRLGRTVRSVPLPPPVLKPVNVYRKHMSRYLCLRRSRPRLAVKRCERSRRYRSYFRTDP
jgi:hypothetical protein